MKQVFLVGSIDVKRFKVLGCSNIEIWLPWNQPLRILATWYRAKSFWNANASLPWKTYGKLQFVLQYFIYVFQGIQVPINHINPANKICCHTITYDRSDWVLYAPRWCLYAIRMQFFSNSSHWFFSWKYRYSTNSLQQIPNSAFNQHQIGLRYFNL